MTAGVAVAPAVAGPGPAERLREWAPAVAVFAGALVAWELLVRVLGLQQFILPEMVHHGFAGQTLRMKYDVLNDVYRPADLTFKWSLIGPDDKPVGPASRVFTPRLAS